MYILRLFLAAVLLPSLAGAQQHVSFSTQDGGVVHADVYGRGGRGLVLAHGGRFNKESWKEQVPAFLNAGFRVLAINFRGRGQSRGPQFKSGEEGAEYDVLAAVRYLHKTARKLYRLSEQVLEVRRPLTPRLTPSLERSIDWCCWQRGPIGHQKKSKVVSCSLSRETTQTDEGPRLPRFARTTRKLRARKSCSFSMAQPTHSFCSRQTSETVAARNPALPSTALSRARSLEELHSAVLLMAGS